MAAAKDAEALIIATEWPEFAAIDLNELRETMRTPLIFDRSQPAGPRRSGRLWLPVSRHRPWCRR